MWHVYNHITHVFIINSTNDTTIKLCLPPSVPPALITNLQPQIEASDKKWHFLSTTTAERKSLKSITSINVSSCFLSCYQPCDRARDYPFPLALSPLLLLPRLFYAATCCRIIFCVEEDDGKNDNDERRMSQENNILWWNRWKPRAENANAVTVEAS